MTIDRADLASTDFGGEVTGERLAYVTPGDVLRHEFMAPLGLSARALAREIEVPVTRITEILKAERAVTAETALRLGRRFGTSPEFWLGHQAAHDL
jgi:antitoxin HigA-1